MRLGARVPSFVRRPGFWIGAFVVLVAPLVIWLWMRGPKVTTAPAIRKDIEQHVVASGRVWVPARVQISTQTSGLVLTVGAVEGQHVAKGDLLLELDDSEARATLAQWKAAADQAGGRVEQLRKVGSIVATETTRQADANLTRAEAELARVETLVRSGSLAPSALEEAERSVAVARAQRTSADVQRISSAPTGADSRIALSALLQAQAQLAGAKARLAQTRILAPRAGVVLTRSVEPGDVVQPGRVLLVIAGGAEDGQLVIEPDERSLAWIKLGQIARASADAYPQEPFDAAVAYIAPSIDPQRGSIEVRLQVPKPPPFLRPDMTVSVDLTVATKAGALVVPTASIRGGATRSPWLLSVRDGRVARRDVKLGIHGEGFTEIVAGLEGDDEVVIGTERVLTPGERVRAARGAP